MKKHKWTPLELKELKEQMSNAPWPMVPQPKPRTKLLEKLIGKFDYYEDVTPYKVEGCMLTYLTPPQKIRHNYILGILAGIIAFLIGLWGHYASIQYADQLRAEGKNPDSYMEAPSPF